jgi:hypothetical protein
MTLASTERSLRHALEEALALLDGVAESFWSAKIRTAIGGSIDPADVLSWYGGMGSFNDLILAGVNGHRIRREDEASLNERLDELTSRIHELAKQLLD